MIAYHGNIEKPACGSCGSDTCGQDLERCAFDLVDKYQRGQLPELQQTGWTATWKHLVRDLRTACPGFSDIAYGIALNHAFIQR